MVTANPTDTIDDSMRYKKIEGLPGGFGAQGSCYKVKTKSQDDDTMYILKRIGMEKMDEAGRRRSKQAATILA